MDDLSDNEVAIATGEGAEGCAALRPRGFMEPIVVQRNIQNG